MPEPTRGFRQMFKVKSFVDYSLKLTEGGISESPL